MALAADDGEAVIMARMFAHVKEKEASAMLNKRRKEWPKVREELQMDENLERRLLELNMDLPLDLPEPKVLDALVQEVVAHVLIEHGFAADGEPTGDGLRLEDLIDDLNHLRFSY